MFLGVVEPCKGGVGGEGGGSCLSSLTRTALLNQFYKMLSRGVMAGGASSLKIPKDG